MIAIIVCCFSALVMLIMLATDIDSVHVRYNVFVYEIVDEV